MITHGVGAGGGGGGVMMATSGTTSRRTWQNVNSKRRLQRIQNGQEGKRHQKKVKAWWHAATLFSLFYIHSSTHTFNRLIRRIGWSFDTSNFKLPYLCGNNLSAPSCFCVCSFCFWGEVSSSWILNDIGRNSLLGNRKKITKFLMRTFTCRSTFLYGAPKIPMSSETELEFLKNLGGLGIE